MVFRFIIWLLILSFFSPSSIQAFSPEITLRPFVYLIQDAHGDYEAQKNIERIILDLHKRHQVKDLFLEGAHKELKPWLFHFSSDPARNGKMIDDLMKQGRVSGAEAFLAGAHPKVRGYGIEDRDLYRDDLRLFRKVMKNESGRRELSRFFEKQISAVERKGISRDLREFVRMWRKFSRHEIPSNSFVEELARVLKEFHEVDVEQFLLHGDSPVETLLPRIQFLAERAFDFLAGSPYEREYVELVQNAELLRKLVSLELTRREFLSLSSRPRVTTGAGMIKVFEGLLEDSLSFYQLAIQREEYFARNSMDRIKSPSIMITGGFHSEGLKERLKASGIPFLEIRPKASTDASSRNVYLKVMGVDESHIAPISELLFPEERRELDPSFSARSSGGSLGKETEAFSAEQFSSPPLLTLNLNEPISEILAARIKGQWEEHRSNFNEVHPKEDFLSSREVIVDLILKGNGQIEIATLPRFAKDKLGRIMNVHHPNLAALTQMNVGDMFRIVFLEERGENGKSIFNVSVYSNKMIAELLSQSQSGIPYEQYPFNMKLRDEVLLVARLVFSIFKSKTFNLREDALSRISIIGQTLFEPWFTQNEIQSVSQAGYQNLSKISTFTLTTEMKAAAGSLGSNVPLLVSQTRAIPPGPYFFMRAGRLKWDKGQLHALRLGLNPELVLPGLDLYQFSGDRRKDWKRNHDANVLETVEMVKEMIERGVQSFANRSRRYYIGNGPLDGFYTDYDWYKIHQMLHDVFLTTISEDARQRFFELVRAEQERLLRVDPENFKIFDHNFRYPFGFNFTVTQNFRHSAKEFIALSEAFSSLGAEYLEENLKQRGYHYYQDVGGSHVNKSPFYSFFDHINLITPQKYLEDLNTALSTASSLGVTGDDGWFERVDGLDVGVILSHPVFREVLGFQFQKARFFPKEFFEDLILFVRKNGHSNILSYLAHLGSVEFPLTEVLEFEKFRRNRHKDTRLRIDPYERMSRFFRHPDQLSRFYSQFRSLLKAKKGELYQESIPFIVIDIVGPGVFEEPLTLLSLIKTAYEKEGVTLEQIPLTLNILDVNRSAFNAFKSSIIFYPYRLGKLEVEGWGFQKLLNTASIRSFLYSGRAGIKEHFDYFIRDLESHILNDPRNVLLLDQTEIEKNLRALFVSLKGTGDEVEMVRVNFDDGQLAPWFNVFHYRVWPELDKRGANFIFVNNVLMYVGNKDAFRASILARISPGGAVFTTDEILNQRAVTLGINQDLSDQGMRINEHSVEAIAESLGATQYQDEYWPMPGDGSAATYRELVDRFSWVGSTDEKIVGRRDALVIRTATYMLEKQNVVDFLRFYGPTLIPQTSAEEIIRRFIVTPGGAAIAEENRHGFAEFMFMEAVIARRKYKKEMEELSRLEHQGKIDDALSAWNRAFEFLMKAEAAFAASIYYYQAPRVEFSVFDEDESAMNSIRDRLLLRKRQSGNEGPNVGAFSLGVKDDLKKAFLAMA